MKLMCGNSIDKLKELDANSIDAIVSDPPYGLSNHTPEDIVECLKMWLDDKEYSHDSKGFMGKSWDSFVPSPLLWKEVFRVLKPGGHLAIFAGTRTHDLMAISLRLAGFTFRDTIMWVYGSGFPKSQDVSKAIDNHFGAEREVIGKSDRHGGGTTEFFEGTLGNSSIPNITAPSTEEAKKWEGFGSAIKPAHEPILLFRKPLEGTMAENVLKYGVGGLNIDGCRVPIDEIVDASQLRTMNRNQRTDDTSGQVWGTNKNGSDNPTVVSLKGRFPANIIHDGSEEVLKGFPETKSGGGIKGNREDYKNDNINFQVSRKFRPVGIGGDSGSASRFFYTAKASKADRDEGLEEFQPKQYSHDGRETPTETAYQRNDSIAKNNHPTVKPTSLMRYVCKLITPPKGVILDPFNGSGSTGKAAILEDFDYIGIDLDENYIKISEARIKYAQKLKAEEIANKPITLNKFLKK